MLSRGGLLRNFHAGYKKKMQGERKRVCDHRMGTGIFGEEEFVFADALRGGESSS